MMKKSIIYLFSTLLILLSCRKAPKDNSRYMETLTYNDDASTYQREWYLSSAKEDISAIHQTTQEEELDGIERNYFMNIILSEDKKSDEMWAFSYDNLDGMLNEKYTKQRIYSYTGEKYLKYNQINFKGTFKETIVYYDPNGVLPNDTTERSGTFVLEYKGKFKK